MWHDLRQAVRTLRKHPGFAALAAIVLALGIGLNTAIFSVVYAMLFKPLPVHDPDSLVSIYVTTKRQPDRPFIMFWKEAEFFRDHSGAFEDVTMHWGTSYPMRVDAEMQLVNAEVVTANYFDVLGVRPLLGRTFLAVDDDASNPDAALVISHALWVRRFDSDPNIIGTEVRLTPWNAPDLVFTIVGVMSPGFTGVSEPWKPTQAWLTFASSRPPVPRAATPSGPAIARLKPGVSLRQAQAILAAQSRQAGRLVWAPGTEPRYHVFKTQDVHVPNDPSAAVVPVRLAGAMTIVVAMVLLVAAANIAGILTARGVGRSGEIAVRRVLGAAPLRIVRQLLAESVLLAVAGGVLGFLLAAWLLDLFRALTPLQYAFDVALEARVVLFTALVCLAAGIVVGVMPAWQAMKLDVLPWLAGSGQMQTGQSRRALRHAITLPQVAVSLVLLLVAGVYVRALLKVELTDPGYQPRNLVVARPFLRLQPGESTNTPTGATREAYAERSRRFYRQLFERLRTMPGAQDVAIADTLPLREPAERPSWTIVQEDDYLAGAREGPGVERASVSPGYFRTMGMRLVAGRDFDERDTRSMGGVAVVSASAARQLWPGRDAIGRSVTLLETGSPNDRITWYEVVGVVSDVRPVLQEREARPFVYFSLGQHWRPSSSYVLVRAAGDLLSLIPAVTSAVTGADPFSDVRQAQTLSAMVAQILYPRRVAAAVLAVSGAVALFLATIGIYGVVSYSVAQPTGEIGIRMALGAERGHIMRLVLQEGTTIAAVGAVAGLALGYAAIRITSSRYLALPAVDPATLLVTPLVIGAVVLLACWLPARRAGRVDPMEVLRRV